MRLLLLLVGGSLGCSRSSGREEQTESLKHRPAAVRFAGSDGGVDLPMPNSKWCRTGELATARDDHTATLLPTGKVLVAGGADRNGALIGAEVYDPDAGTWSATGQLNTRRYLHTATLLPSGKVLVAGGGAAHDALTSAEVYDPDAGTWSATGALDAGRYQHTATLLASGKVLVVGGRDSTGALASAEVYDPDTKTWSPAGTLAIRRYLHTATLLPSGKVLVAGGYLDETTPHLASAEVYDPDADTWSPTAPLGAGRNLHTAMLLPSGKVLVTGGQGPDSILNSSEVYDPDTETWDPTDDLGTGRKQHTATQLPSGRVLVAGGYGPSGMLDDAEVYDPDAGTWSPAGKLATARFDHTTTLLPSGKLLVAGGYDDRNTTHPYLNSVEVPSVLTRVMAPANGTATSNRRPGYSGTAAADSTVTVIVDGLDAGSTTATSECSWSLSPTPPLDVGTHTVKAVAWDAGTNTDSNTNTFKVDIGTQVDLLLPNQGAVLTNPVVRYSGTAEPRAMVTVVVGIQTVGTVNADAEGRWSLLADSTLDDGTHRVRVTARDAASNTATDVHTVSVDTRTEVVITAPAEGAMVTHAVVPYSGTAEPGAAVTVVVGNQTVGTVTANAQGDWSVPAGSSLSDGLHEVQATAFDLHGNRATDIHTFTVDTSTRVAITAPGDGAVLSNPLIAYEGTAEPLATVVVVVHEQTVGSVTADTRGDWSVTATTRLDDGTHTVTATASDALGHTATDTHALTVDTTAPAAPVVLAPADGSTTRDSTPTYTGTAEVGSTVTLIVDGAEVGTIAAGAGGSWSFTPVASLADGSHHVSAHARDAVGNTGPDSTPRTFTVDTTAPAAPVVSEPANGAALNDDTPTYQGTAEAGSAVTVTVDGAVVDTTTADTSGNWSFTQPSALADGSYRVHATATDVTGNVSAMSEPHDFIVDTTAPAAPVVLTPANGSTTYDVTPGFSGTAEAFSTITLVVDGNPVGTPTADAEGAWRFASTTALEAGPHSVHARATDAVGNTSPNSSPHTFTVNTDLSRGGWRTTGELSTARGNHTATLLLDSGKVLVTGGENSNVPLASSELYDPVTGGWSSTRALATARTGHTATLLDSGKVLVTGGDALSERALASAELYDPDTETWSPAGALTTARRGHSAAKLPSDQLLVFGGEDAAGAALASAELYDPVTNAWSLVGELETARTDHTATVLPEGQVLVTGGKGSSGPLASVELYDPATRAWRTLRPMNTARTGHTAVLLPPDQVLVTGGENASGLLTSAELYDLATDMWSTTYALATARAHLTAVPLPSGRVLVTGSDGPDAGTLAGTEVYTPSTGIWSPTGILEKARRGHAATQLLSGEVLVTGGWGEAGGALASTEVYGSLGATRPAAPLAEPRTDAMAVVLRNGQVLVAGGSGPSGFLASAQLYDPVTEQWSTTPPLGTARSSATATLLATGEVLVTGGSNGGSRNLKARSTGGTALQSTEVFDPATNTWRFTGSLNDARYSHGALLLSTGDVLVTGGIGEDGTPLSTTELYSPATGTWRRTGPLRTPRRHHMVAQLPTGHVLVAGGMNTRGAPLSSAEVFDPLTGEWTEILPMSTPRVSSTVAVLHTSQLLVAGGTNGRQALGTAELYDPLTGKWSSVGSLHKARKAHSAQLLPTGRVLIAGGSNDTRHLDNVEVYDPRSQEWEEMTTLVTPREDSMTVQLYTGQILIIAGRNAAGPLASTEVYDEYGAPEPLRPAVNPVGAHPPGANLVLRGRSMMAPDGGSQRVLLQTVPKGERFDAVATGFSPSSVNVTLPPAPDGDHLLFVLVNDIAGGQVVSVDGTSPGAPLATVSRKTPQLTFSGQAEPGSTVRVSLNGSVAGEARALATGNWSLLLPGAPADGDYSGTAVAVDAAGNTSQPYSFRFSVDTKAPAAPVLKPLDAFINGPRPTVSGTAEPISTVTVSVDGTVERQVAADLEGLWSVTLSTVLKDGEHTVSASATDPEGNKGQDSARLTFTVDTRVPPAPEVLSPQEGDTLDSQSASAHGTAESLSTVTVSVDGKDSTTQADSTGAWSLSLPTGLRKGAHTLMVTATDRAGNISPSSPRTFTVDVANGFTGSGCSGCAAGSGEPSLMLLGLAVLGRRLARRRVPPA
jgi:N-acetylneuraminic acid mutarotase